MQPDEHVRSLTQSFARPDKSKFLTLDVDVKLDYYIPLAISNPSIQLGGEPFESTLERSTGPIPNGLDAFEWSLYCDPAILGHLQR